MPEQDKKLVAHMQTIAEREIKAKKVRLAGRGSGGGGNSRSVGGDEGDAGISKALRTFDAIMEGEKNYTALFIVCVGFLFSFLSICNALLSRT